MKTDKLIDFKFFEDIIYYDGPLLSLGITQDNLPVLQICCDINNADKYNLYSYVFINKDDLYSFINGEKSYLNVLKNSDEIIIFKYNQEAFDFKILNIDSFIKEYGPTDDSNLNHDDLNHFKSFFEIFINKEKHELL